jgi:hypothetical protein
MPDRLDFDSARRVLEEIAPTDTWHAARLRAAAGSLVQLDAEEATVSTRRPQGHRSRTIRLVSIAACLLAVVAVAAVVMADREAVDTTDPAEAPTTSPERVTTEQYGGVVSEHSTAIQAWIDREESSDHVEDSFPQYVRERYDELRPLLAQFQQALTELPSPPPEIATLVDTTERQVSDALHSVDVLLSCPEPSRIKCPDEYSEAETAYRALPELFAAWRAYIPGTDQDG